MKTQKKEQEAKNQRKKRIISFFTFFAGLLFFSSIVFAAPLPSLVNSGDTMTAENWNRAVTKFGDITTSEITDGTISNIDINASAGITGAKIDPNFGAQNISTTGSVCLSGDCKAAWPAGMWTQTGSTVYYNTGRIGIGTQVPGGKMVIVGEGTTSATYGLNVTKSTGVSNFFVRDDGNVGIGTTAPSEKLEVVGNIKLSAASPTISTALNAYLDIKATNPGGAVRIYSGNALSLFSNSSQIILMTSLAGTGTRTVNANASGELSAGSDSRLKQEVHDEKLPGLSEILKIQPKAYKWLDDIENRGDDAAVEIGFFADQVAPIIPSAAPKGRNGMYGFYDRSMSAALVKAVQELNQKMIELQSENDALQKRIEVLENR